METGIIFNNSIVSAQTVAQVLKCSKSDLSITHDVTEENLILKRGTKQKVKYAAKLFSHSMARAMRRCYSMGVEIYNAINSSELFELINDWFDVSNSKLSTANSIPTKQPYGKNLAVQDDVLNKMTELMNQVIIPGKKSLVPFQKGIIVSNKSLHGLLQHLNNKYSIEYILTSRLNQDIIENFFSAMRGRGGFDDHPTPIQFRYRLRKYLLGN